MEDYRKQAKIEALNKAFPGKSCGDLRCEELCAEAYDAAKSMRLDPKEAIRKTIEREQCCPQAGPMQEKCRFGFGFYVDSIVLSSKDKKKEASIIHIFHTGINECKKCQDLDGTRISPEDWASESRMKAKGFWKQKNGEYLPHPHCRCHWEVLPVSEYEKTKKQSPEDTVTPTVISSQKNTDTKVESEKQQEKQPIAQDSSAHSVDVKTSSVKTIEMDTKKLVEEAIRENTEQRGKLKDPFFPELPKSWKNASQVYDRKQAYMYNTELKPNELHRLTFHIKNQGFLGLNPFILGDGIESAEDLVRQIEKKNYLPHSIISIIIIGHGYKNIFPMGINEDGEESTIHDFKGRLADRLKFYLHKNCVIEFRICKAVQDESGKKLARDFANEIGCVVKAYEGAVDPNGNKPIYTPRDDDEMKQSWKSRLFLESKPKLFYPTVLEKNKK